MHRPETGHKSKNRTKKVNDYLRVTFIFFFCLFPKVSIIIIYYFCENKKINVIKRCAQKQEAEV